MSKKRINDSDQEAKQSPDLHDKCFHSNLHISQHIEFMQIIPCRLAFSIRCVQPNRRIIREEILASLFNGCCYISARMPLPRGKKVLNFTVDEVQNRLSLPVRGTFEVVFASIPNPKLSVYQLQEDLPIHSTTLLTDEELIAAADDGLYLLHHKYFLKFYKLFDGKFGRGLWSHNGLVTALNIGTNEILSLSFASNNTDYGVVKFKMKTYTLCFPDTVARIDSVILIASCFGKLYRMSSEGAALGIFEFTPLEYPITPAVCAITEVKKDLILCDWRHQRIYTITDPTLNCASVGMAPGILPIDMSPWDIVQLDGKTLAMLNGERQSDGSIAYEIIYISVGRDVRAKII